MNTTEFLFRIDEFAIGGEEKCFVSPNALPLIETFKKESINDAMEKLLDVDLALEINRFVHNSCKDVPHDIGLNIIKLIKNKL